MSVLDAVRDARALFRAHLYSVLYITRLARGVTDARVHRIRWNITAINQRQTVAEVTTVRQFFSAPLGSGFCHAARIPPQLGQLAAALCKEFHVFRERGGFLKKKKKKRGKRKEKRGSGIVSPRDISEPRAEIKLSPRYVGEERKSVTSDD